MLSELRGHNEATRLRHAFRLCCGLAAYSTSAAIGAPCGWLTGSPEADATPFLTAFRKGLGEMGFFEGKNVAFEYRWANFHYERLPVMAAEISPTSLSVLSAFRGPTTRLPAQAANSAVAVGFF